MKDFITKLLSNNLVEAQELLEQRILEIVDEKLDQIEERLANEIAEGNIQRIGRTKLIRVRFRGGKLQRRVKKSAVAGYTFRGGKLTRMSPQERRRRKMAARRSKFKRRSKLRQSLRKRQMSLRKRKAMGL
ncbi:hypothetical protein EBU71_19520 [bacterium]|nr:hypothetical protein [Candidatus Elulimicrobium humile]